MRRGKLLTPQEKSGIKSGRWEIDCPEMELRSRASDGDSFRGPGLIRVTESGDITFKLFAKAKEPQKDEIFTFGGPVAGTVLPNDSYFDLVARDSLGRVWNASRLSAESDTNWAMSTVVWAGELPALVHREEIGGEVRRGTITLEFFSAVELPCNATTESERSVAGARERSWAMNAARFASAGYDFALDKTVGGLVVHVTAPSTDIPATLEVRVTEALQFVLASSLWWSLAERRDGGTYQVEIRRRPGGGVATQLRRPVAHQDVDSEGKAWQLFDAYFRYVMRDTSSNWHRLSHLVHSTIEAGAGSLYALALALAVSVEGVLRLRFAHACLPSPKFHDEVSKAQELIQTSAILPRVRTRINGSIGAMKGFRAQTGLERLVEMGAITAAEVAAWKELRHKAAHADQLDSLDIQTLLDLCLRLTVLFYRLVFTAIDYEGSYTDYGHRGWTERKHGRVDVDAYVIPECDDVRDGPA